MKNLSCSHRLPLFKLRLLVLILAIHTLPYLGAAQHYSGSEIIVKLRKEIRTSPKSSSETSRTGFPSLDALNAQFDVRYIDAVFEQSPSSVNAAVRDELGLDRVLKFVLPEDSDIDQIVAAFNADPHVEYAQSNHVYRVDFEPDDPQLKNQWALTRTEAFRAWEIEQGSRDVLIAIIDTGIDYDHEDLAANIWINEIEDLNRNGAVDSTDFNGQDDDANGFVDDIQGWDFTDAPFFSDGGDYLDRDNDPADEHGHGTSVAGIAAAVADNGLGVAGLAFGCRLMNLRAGTSRGLLEEDDVASALAYAADNGARVVNMSFGDVVSSPLFRDAVTYAHSCGLLLVASAGNSSTDEIHYPSGFEQTLSVGSTDSADYISGFSNFGSTVDVVAPGSSILTTQMGNEYSPVNGTSAAAPFVSALAALVFSLHPEYSHENVQGVILSSSDDIGSLGWDRYYASGRINAYNTLRTDIYTVARILWPRMDQGFARGNVQVIGTASGVQMKAYRLLYGAGDDPDEWQEITYVSNSQIIEDLLGTWNVESLQDTSYVLRLSVENYDGAVVNQTVRVFVDRTPPKVTNITQTPMIEGDEYAVLLEFTTDDLCQSRLQFHESGTADILSEITLPYETTQHHILLTAAEVPVGAMAQLWLRNGSGLITIDDNNGTGYQIDLSLEPISSVEFVTVPYTLGSSYLLNTAPDFDHDGNLEFVLNEYSSDNAFGSLKVVEFTGSGFEEVFDSKTLAIPRDVGDSDGDGRMEILAGAGQESIIYEQTSSSSTSFHISWRNANNFWAGRFADVDSDGKTEIIARIDETFQIWENEGDNYYVFRDSLPNPTAGSNITGVPHVEVGDFDGDNRQEILIGDYDGEVYIYESHGDNQVTHTWSDSLPLMDTIDFLTSGDYDGDGLKEFVVGAHSDPQLDAEHEYDARHWLYRVYDPSGDNTYQVSQEWRFFGFSSPKDFDAGVSSGDVNGDGREEILVNVFPDFYIIDYDATSGHYTPMWHYRPNRSNAAVTADLNGNGIAELYFNDGQTVLGFELLQEAGGPPAPKSVDAVPLDTVTVEVTWNSVAEADGYWVYWGQVQDDVARSLWTIEPRALAAGLIKDQVYWFAVTAVDSSRSPIESRLSRKVSATPNAPPALLGAEAISEYSIRLRFTELMNSSVKDPSNYTVSGMNEHPSSALLHKSGSEVILTLLETLLPGSDYSVLVTNVFDIDRTPIDTTLNSAEFRLLATPEPPYLVNASVRGRTSIVLTFSQALERQGAEQTENYRIDPAVNIYGAALDASDAHLVMLQVDPLVPLGGENERRILYVTNVKNEQGIPIQTGRGDRYALALTKQDLSEVFTYPNPYSPCTGADGITFANLTEQATIHILTLDGRVIRVLEEKDGNGGLLWDARNSEGESVGSGIYLFYIKSENDSKVGKLAIVR